jgi:hypothetical protein
MLSKSVSKRLAVQRSKVADPGAEHRPCIRCGREGETRNCHYNGFRQHQYGKGRGVKCADTMTAEFCQACDDLFSEKNYGMWARLGGSKSIERSEEFLHWISMTNIRRANA